MGIFSSEPGKTSETSTSTSTVAPSEKIAGQWDEQLGQSKDIRDNALANPPPLADVAAPSDLTGKYWQQSGQLGQFDTSYYHQPLRETYGETTGARVDPTGINYNQNYNFGPGALDFANPYAAGVPKVGMGGGLGATAGDYAIPTERVNARDVTAERISAPRPIDPITGLERVSGPTLEQYQMGRADQVQGQNVRDFQQAAAERVSAPELQQYSMQAAQNISPTGLASTQSWTDPGVAQRYMSPYQEQVANVQQKRAMEDWQVQNQQLGSEAARAGAFGGSRHAVREATAARDMQDQMAMIEATGLQNAYQQGMGQFSGEQQLGLGAQQFNLGQGMQASMANQAAQQAAAQANLQAQLQTQGLGAGLNMQGQLANQAANMQVGQNNLAALQQAEALRTGYGQQAGLANQAANMQVGQTNLGALLQTQGLGAGLNMQAQLANQGQTFQQQIANMEAQKFGASQQMQASLANQQANLAAQQGNQTANLQGQLANQQTGLQSGLASAQMGQAGAMFNAQQGMQGQLANQAAMMAAMNQQYGGGLQGALQTQQLGMQGQMAGAQMGQTAGFQQDAAKLAAMGYNLSALNSQGQMAQNMANLGLAGYGANIAGNQATGQAAQNQQNYQQQQQDVQYQNAMNQWQNPFQVNNWYAQQLAMQPQAYTQNQNQTSQGTQIASQPGLFQQIVGGALGAAGMFVPGRKARGGVIKLARGGGLGATDWSSVTPGPYDFLNAQPPPNSYGVSGDWEAPRTGVGRGLERAVQTITAPQQFVRKHLEKLDKRLSPKAPYAGGSPVTMQDALPPPTGNPYIDAALLAADVVPGAGKAFRAIGRGAEGLEAFRQTIAKNPKMLKNFERAMSGSHAFRETLPHLSHGEASSLLTSPQAIKKFESLLREMPNAQRLSAMAKVGAPKRGWYKASAQAISDIFGMDAPRFAQLLAAMSPQTSVESNLQNSLRMWKNWDAAGRPRDPKQIQALLGQSVHGMKDMDSILPAWIPNTVRALEAVDPRTVTMSGPKVDSFYHNLLGNVNRVTNDTWMGIVLGVPQKVFGKSASAAMRAAGNPGYTPGYAAASGRVREASGLAGMLPYEGQETMWSGTKAMYELAQKHGISPQEVLDRGLLTREAVAGTPDFATLIRQPGYVENIHARPELAAAMERSKLQPFNAPDMPLTLADQRELSGLASTIGQAQSMRNIGKNASRFPVREARSGTAFTPVEWTPGGEGILPRAASLPLEQRKKLTSRGMSRFENIHGQNVLLEKAGIKNAPGVHATGAYQPDAVGGVLPPPQTNPTRVYRSEVPLTAQGEMFPETERKLNAVNHGLAYLFGQQGVGHHMPVRPATAPKGQTQRVGRGMTLKTGEPVPQATMEKAVAAHPELVFADTAKTVNVFSPGSKKGLPEAIRKNIRGIFGVKDVDVDVPGGYGGLGDLWRKGEGSRAATRKVVKEFDRAFTLDELQGINQEIAARVGGHRADLMKQAKATGDYIRPDFLNALDIMSKKQGLAGLKQELKKGKKAFLPGAIGAVTIPSFLSRSHEEDAEEDDQTGPLF